MLLNLTDEDEGKTVVAHNGERIGEIVRLENGRAYVEPEDVVPGRVRRKLGWGDGTDDQFVLSNSMVHSITAEEVRIRR